MSPLRRSATVLACAWLLLGACKRSPRSAPADPPPAPAGPQEATPPVHDAAPPDAPEDVKPAAVVGSLGIGPVPGPCQVDADCVVSNFEGCCRCCACGAPRAASKQDVKRRHDICALADCAGNLCRKGEAKTCQICQPDRPARCQQGACVMP